MARRDGYGGIVAVYPEGNPGKVPLDPDSDVGKLRLIIGDTAYQEYDPPEPGWGNYAAFSDAELQALLDAADGDFNSAVGYAYLKLAGAAIGAAFEWATDDLRVNLSRTPSQALEIAKFWFGRGSAEGGAIDVFEIGPFAPRDPRKDELAEGIWPWGITHW